MGRKKTPLNITRQPGVGMAYVAKRLSDDALVRVATLCARDQKREPDLAPIRKFSGDEPFFKARITRADGGAKIDPITLVFDCKESSPTCTAEADGVTYEWLDLDHKVAVADGLTIVNDTPAKPVKKVKTEDAPADAVTEATHTEVEAMTEETDFVDLETMGVTEDTVEEVEAVTAMPNGRDIPFVKKVTLYRVVDGEIKTRRAKTLKDGEYLSKDEALASV